jgi:cellulose synthase/poly-beta-1,6-N-acetylglucosamine synthase-like glycosyltransferase
VVIPCYSQAPFLGEAIESVLAQSYQRYEIVVVDDDSTDDTSEVVSRYRKVRCIRQRNTRSAPSSSVTTTSQPTDHLLQPHTDLSDEPVHLSLR